MALAGANPLPGMEQVAVKRTDGFSIVADAGFWVYPPGRLFVFLVESWRKWRLQCSKNRRILPHPLFGHQIEHFPTISITTYCPFLVVIFGHKKPRVSCPRLALKGETSPKRSEWRFGSESVEPVVVSYPDHYGSMGRRPGIFTYMIPIKSYQSTIKNQPAIHV